MIHYYQPLLSTASHPGPLGPVLSWLRPARQSHGCLRKTGDTPQATGPRKRGIACLPGRWRVANSPALVVDDSEFNSD